MTSSGSFVVSASVTAVVPVNPSGLLRTHGCTSDSGVAMPFMCSHTPRDTTGGPLGDAGTKIIDNVVYFSEPAA